MGLIDSSSVFKLKLSSFALAVQQLAQLLGIDFDHVFTGNPQAEILIDGLKNGQAQKFELTTELCWKAIQSALYNVDGVQEASPKKVIKAFFLGGYITEYQYSLLIACIDDRNRLSHLYDANEFTNITHKFPQYLSVFQQIEQTLKQLP